MKKMKLFALVAVAAMATVAFINSDAFAGAGNTKIRHYGSRLVDGEETERCCYKEGWECCKKTTEELSTCPIYECE